MNKILLASLFILASFNIANMYKVSKLQLENKTLILNEQSLLLEKQDLKRALQAINNVRLKEEELKKEVQGIKDNFKEEENEELNDNLQSALTFVSERMCKKGN